jgi:hypothetical protein
MATSKAGRKGLDEQQLEGGGAGGGLSGTKWSGTPSLKGRANIVDDFKKLTAPPTKAKGAAKRSVELAEDRAASRMVARAAGAATGIAGAAALSSESKPKNGSNNEFMGDVRADPKNPTSVEGTGMAKGGLVKNKMSAYNAVYMGKDKRK